MGTSFAMEKPLQKSLFAPDEVVQEAIIAVTNDHLKRLQVLLENHMFEQTDLLSLLTHSMGDKNLDKEYMGAFVLLLQHGAPADAEIFVDSYVDEPYLGSLLNYAQKKYSNYVLPLLLFGAKPTAMQPDIQTAACNLSIGVFGKYGKTFLRSQATGKPIPLAQARQRFTHQALTHCSTYQEAVRHEDINALRLLLAKPFVGNAQEKDRQLGCAVNEAFKLESTAALDELAKHGAPIAQRLNLHFLFNPEVIEHCARNGYITLQDLANYKARIPERKIGMMWQWTQQKFETHMGRLKAVIDSAIRLLERGELEKVETHKKARTEKKDE